MITFKMECEWCGQKGEAKLDYKKWLYNQSNSEIQNIIENAGFGYMVYRGDYTRKQLPKDMPEIKAFICVKCNNLFKELKEKLEKEWINSIKNLVMKFSKN